MKDKFSSIVLSMALLNAISSGYIGLLFYFMKKNIRYDSFIIVPFLSIGLLTTLALDLKIKKGRNVLFYIYMHIVFLVIMAIYLIIL